MSFYGLIECALNNFPGVREYSSPRWTQSLRKIYSPIIKLLREKLSPKDINFSGSLQEFEASVWEQFSSKKLVVSDIVDSCKESDIHLQSFSWTICETLYAGGFYDECVDAVDRFVSFALSKCGKLDEILHLKMDSLIAKNNSWEKLEENLKRFEKQLKASYFVYKAQYYQNQLPTPALL